MSIFNFLSDVADTALATPIRLVKSVKEVVVDDRPVSHIATTVANGFNKDLDVLKKDLADITDKNR